MGISPFDIVVVVVVIVLMVRGAMRGFITEILSTAAPFFGILCGALISGHIAPVFSFLTGSPDNFINRIIAFLVVFLVIYLVSFILQRVFHQIIDELNLENADRALGFFVGALEGIAVVIFAVLIMSLLPFQEVCTLLFDSMAGRLLLPLLPSSHELF
ncbi:MAG: CvpA family protein [Spirochaetales bacterium]|nr:CvpA family protein [Spirochaetales bacterium]